MTVDSGGKLEHQSAIIVVCTNLFDDDDGGDKGGDGKHNVHFPLLPRPNDVVLDNCATIKWALKKLQVKVVSPARP